MRGIITLCGSVRFKRKFMEVAHVLTIWGYVVLMPNVWRHSDLHREQNVRIKESLDMLHKDKIRMSDSIVVIDVDGYIGSSTRGEIEFAEREDKVIYRLIDYGMLETRGK